ncbi:Hypothetical protein SCF082_LOCUS20430, partial [Durusdinium trenchii]
KIEIFQAVCAMRSNQPPRGSFGGCEDAQKPFTRHDRVWKLRGRVDPHAAARMKTAAMGAVCAGVAIKMLWGLAWLQVITFAPLSQSPELRERMMAWLTAHQMEDTPGPTVEPDHLSNFERDGFVVVKGFLEPDTVEIFRDVVEHMLRFPNADTLLIDKYCTAFSFATGGLLPEFGEMLKTLPANEVVAEVMGADKVTLINDIVHWNPKSCDHIGAVLSTHSDMNTAPFSIERKPNGWFGDNSLVVWIALDTLDNSTMTMDLSRGSHRAYDQRYGTQEPFRYENYCALQDDDLQRESAGDPAFLNSFERLPRLNPGDAVLFSGLSLHRPLPLCRGPHGCQTNNTRRLTLRYIDTDRTVFRNDTPSVANHPMTRRCPWPSAMWEMLGKCRDKPGNTVFKHVEGEGHEVVKLPIVFPKSERQLLPLERLDSVTPLVPHWTYFLNAGTRVHHGVCSLESVYARKIARRLAYNVLPQVVDDALFG